MKRQRVTCVESPELFALAVEPLRLTVWRLVKSTLLLLMPGLVAAFGIRGFASAAGVPFGGNGVMNPQVGSPENFIASGAFVVLGTIGMVLVIQGLYWAFTVREEVLIDRFTITIRHSGRRLQYEKVVPVAGVIDIRVVDTSARKPDLMMACSLGAWDNVHNLSRRPIVGFDCNGEWHYFGLWLRKTEAEEIAQWFQRAIDHFGSDTRPDFCVAAPGDSERRA